MNTRSSEFMSEEELRLSDEMLKQGYVSRPVEDRESMNKIRDFIAARAASELSLPSPDDPCHFLDHIGDHIAPDGLNDFRLAIINSLKEEKWFLPAYFKTVKKTVEILVGNELVMQRNPGLSIQLSNDDESLLPLHSDCWQGVSHYAVVVWLPLVDCFKTKSLFILSPDENKKILEKFGEFAEKGVEDIYQAAKDKVEFLDIPYGSFVIFTPTLMHGNRVNVEDTARWSLNLRFKSAFSPYMDKRIGEYYEPITLRPTTRFGLNFEFPNVSK